MNRRPCFKSTALFVVLAAWPPLSLAADTGKPVDLTSWIKEPSSLAGAVVTDDKATLASAKWGFLLSKDEHADGELAATVTIMEPAKFFQLVGHSWSAWLVAGLAAKARK